MSKMKSVDVHLQQFLPPISQFRLFGRWPEIKAPSSLSAKCRLALALARLWPCDLIPK